MPPVPPGGDMLKHAPSVNANFCRFPNLKILCGPLDSVNISTVELPRLLHATIITLYHCQQLDTMTLSCHSCCCLTTQAIDWPCDYTLPTRCQPVSHYVTSVSLLANGCITFPLPSYNVCGIPLHYRHAACHCHATLPERLLSNVVLLGHTVTLLDAVWVLGHSCC